MEVSSNYATSSGAEVAAARRQDAVRTKDTPVGQQPPEPKSRGEAVVYGGSLSNADQGSTSRDAARQSRVEHRHKDEAEARHKASRDHEAQERSRSDARRAESRQRQDSSHEVDVSV